MAIDVVTPATEKTDDVKPNSAINGDVLCVINDMLGREILITTKNNRYTGILSACNSTLDLGFRKVVEVTEENKHHLMKTESEVVEKMIFPFSEIVDMACVHQEDKSHKISSKFVTDRQYHGDIPADNEQLQEWSGGEGDEDMSIEDSESIATPTTVQHGRRNNQNNGAGWSVDDMFAVNEKMNVVSTFKDDLTQYTTVEVVGTDEDRARADRLAREIESNQSSKFYANLENDDVERDLDKTTREDDFEFGGNQRRGKGNNSYNQQQQQRRNPNITPNGQPVNKRAEGLRSDRRNSGSSSANNSRYGPPSQPQNYQPSQGQKGNYNNRRQNEEYRDNDWQMAKGKGQNQAHDQSFRHQQKQMLDPRPSTKQPSNEGEKSQGSSSRVADLKNFSTGFDLVDSKERSPAPGPQGNSASAWNRGPPSSLVSKGSSTESTPPPQGETEEISSSQARVEIASSSEPAPKREELPSTSGEEQDEADGKAADGENLSTTDVSDTSSNATSKSASFKFNINAPEFKPRVAPTTPTPTTPNGPPMPQNMNPVQPQQFVPAEYQQQPLMMQQTGPTGAPMGMPAGMVPHMAPGVVPQNQGQPMMMWAPQSGQQGYVQNQQFPMQQMPMTGVPGQMYGPAANAPVTAHQAGNQQIPTSAAGGAPQDARQVVPQQRRDGEYREAQPCFYPYTQGGPVVPMPQQFYQPQYQPGMQQPQYPVKIVQQQAPQGYQQRYPQQMFIPPGMQQRYPQQPQQQPQQQQQPPQQQYGGEQQGGPQSHPNSQPTTPGPRGDQNMSGKGQQAQNGNNSVGMHREPEGGSNASLSGSTSSQSGQRSGSPQNNAPPSQPPQQQQQQQQVPQQVPQQVQAQGGPMGQAPMVGMQQGHIPYVSMMHPQMHGAHPHYYAQQQQQGMFYTPNVMMVQPQVMQQNHHAQPSMMGERSEQGYPNSNYFDYRNMPPYQQQQQHPQMHGAHMSRQNSLPQQFAGNAQQGVNPVVHQAQPPQQQQQQGGPQREQQQPAQ